MITQDLLGYIQRQRQAGKTDAEIRQALQATGWPEANINEALAPNAAVTAPASVAPSSIKGPLPSIGVLFSESWNLMKQRIGVLFLSYFLPLLGAVIIAGLAVFLWLMSKTSGGYSGVTAALFIIAFLCYLYAILWGTTAQITALRDATEKTGTSENLKRSRKLVWSTLLVALLLNLVVGGGMVLFFIPGIIFMVWYGFGAIVMISEGLKGRAALAQSRAYVTGRSWDVFGRILLLQAIYWAVFIVMQILNFSLHQYTAAAIAASILWFIAVFFLLFFATAYTYTLYLQLRATAGPISGQQYVKSVTGWAIWGAIGWIVILFAIGGFIYMLATFFMRPMYRSNTTPLPGIHRYETSPTPQSPISQPLNQ